MHDQRSELITVTPQMARGWLEHNNYERQRRRAEWQVDRLVIEMRKERFLPGTQIHFGVLGGQMKLLNGQHTLAAVAKSGLPQSLNVLYTPVETDAELGILYGRHDRGRGRTPHDAFLGMGLSERLNLTDRETNSFGSAVRIVLGGFRVVSVHTNVEIATSVDLAAETMADWEPAAALYFEAVREARPGMKSAYRRAAVAAVGIVTMRYQEAKATQFWSGAADDDALGRSDPRRTLNDFLAKNAAKVGDRITYARHIASAWNKFYTEDDLTVLRPIDAGKIGITIRGTPFKALKRSGASVENDMSDPPEPKARQGVLGEGFEARA